MTTTLETVNLKRPTSLSDVRFRIRGVPAHLNLIVGQGVRRVPKRDPSVRSPRCDVRSVKSR